MALSRNGRYLYVVDQGGFYVYVHRFVQGVDGRRCRWKGRGAGQFRCRHRPTQGRPLSVWHHAVARRSHSVRDACWRVRVHASAAEAPTGDPNLDYPLCYPGAGYPNETRHDRRIEVKKVDPRNLPDALRDPDGIRCGYVPSDTVYTVPGLGSPNAPESSSVYVLDVSNPQSPRRRKIVKTGPLVGERAHRNEDEHGDRDDRGKDDKGDREGGAVAYSGSHPNSVVVGRDAVYVANGNNDSISVLDPRTYEERHRIGLSLLRGPDRTLRGLQPVGLALSPDGGYLYVAEAGINAIGVIRLDGMSGRCWDTSRPAGGRALCGSVLTATPVCGECTRPWGFSQSDRGVAVARVHRDWDGEHHRDPVGRAAGGVYGPRLCQRVRGAEDCRRSEQSHPEPAPGRRAIRSSTSSSSTRKTRRTT